MTSGPRFVAISTNPVVAAGQNSDNARDTLEALRGKVTGEFVGPFEYVASDNPDATIALAAPRLPVAVLCVRVQHKSRTDARVASWPYLDFTWDGKTASALVFQPSGLVAGASYLLTFLVMEAT